MYNRDMPVAKPNFYHNLGSKTDEEVGELAKRYMWLSQDRADRPQSFYHKILFRIYGELKRRGRLDLYERAKKEAGELGH